MMTIQHRNRMKLLRNAIGALFVCAFGLPAIALAQARQPAPTIVSDRPGLGDGAHVLAPGVVQGEFGGTIHAQASDDFLVGSSLLRYGFDAFELRVFVPDVVSLHAGEFLRLGDVGVGAKFPLDFGGGWQWAGSGAFTLPTGAHSLTADDPGLGATLLAERGLTPTVGLAINTGYNFLFADVGGGTLSFLATPTFALSGREGTSLYAGYALYVQRGDDAHFIEGGLTRADGPDRQWDVNAGYDPGAHVWFLGVGVAARWR